MTQQLFIRAYPTTLEIADKRTLSGRLVPYNEPANVLDELPGGKRDIYQEGFRPGAFAPQANSTNQGVIAKIGFVHTHVGGLGYMGTFTGLKERADGLYGNVRVMPTKAADLEALLESGVRELSVEFHLPRGSNTEVDAAGIRWRTHAHLVQVALEAKGAYSSAQVLAFRSEMEQEDKEQAEAEAAAEAERKATEEAESADEATKREEHERAEREAEERETRRRLWDELSSRVDSDVMKQEQLVREFGITKPGGFRRPT
jgi:HK97 family phage prohead protease